MVDLSHMRAALSLARRGLGTTWPNPSVGCVVVKDGRVVGRAWTAPGGRPHAETQALAVAGEAARGAVAYVTLEPCNHTGQTPPCTEALIAAGVSRVVVAGGDPDPRVDGSGLARLREAGIEVETGVLAAEADALQAGFLTRIRLGRPWVTLKLASTLDGRIATKGGESQWITGEAARRAGHALRGQNDAVLVGVGTVMTDNPDLTCRIEGYRPSLPSPSGRGRGEGGSWLEDAPLSGESTTLTPALSRQREREQSAGVRVVVDSHLRTRLTARLVATAQDHPTWIVHREGADPSRQQALTEAGVRLIEVQAAEIGVHLPSALQALGAAGLTRVLVEGGAQIAAALLRDELVDALAWFHAPAIMGGDGWPAAQAFGTASLAAIPRFVRTSIRPVGPDILSEYRRAA